ncbi:MAG: hypothetical protein NTU76_04305 [Candidatus Taylorbacteria bacterium]|nr:hypothetical protein [Candidatus Taylorbacteria bacterium]
MTEEIKQNNDELSTKEFREHMASFNVENLRSIVSHYEDDIENFRRRIAEIQETIDSEKRLMMETDAKRLVAIEELRKKEI